MSASGLTKAAIEALIISKNIHRRHLTSDQRAAALQALIKATPEKSDREIARQAKVDHKTIGKQRKKMESGGELSPTAKRTGKDRKQYKATKARVTHKDESALTPAGTNIADAIGVAINGFAAENLTAEASAEQRKAEASEGNRAALDELKACCTRLIPQLDKVDLAEARSHFDRLAKRVAAERKSRS